MYCLIYLTGVAKNRLQVRGRKNHHCVALTGHVLLLAMTTFNYHFLLSFPSLLLIVYTLPKATF